MSAYTVCPKCKFQEPSEVLCSRCGTVFEDWYAARETPKEVIVEREMKRLREYDRREHQRRVIAFVVASLGFILILVFWVVRGFLRLVH